MKWDEWRGSLDGRPTMLVKHLVQLGGFRLDLHRFVAADDPECFHTHPARAFRMVLFGWYVEEIEVGARRLWFPLRCGFVLPATSHRVEVAGGALTLWLRWPKRVEVELRGDGWQRQRGAA